MGVVPRPFRTWTVFLDGWPASLDQTGRLRYRLVALFQKQPLPRLNQLLAGSPYGDLLHLPGYREQVTIRSRNFIIFNVPADGNCLFHSLAAVFCPVMLQRGKTPPSHLEVRRAVMHQYSSMPESLKNFLETNWPQDKQ